MFNVHCLCKSPKMTPNIKRRNTYKNMFSGPLPPNLFACSQLLYQCSVITTYLVPVVVGLSVQEQSQSVVFPHLGPLVYPPAVSLMEGSLSEITIGT